jgi:pilus assembly protein TadC
MRSKLEYQLAEIRRSIKSTSNESEIIELIIKRDELLKKLQSISKKPNRNDAFENMRNSMLY